MEYAVDYPRLIAFGDSWTAGHGVETDVRYTGVAAPAVFIAKLREQNSWPRWVADKMKIPSVNFGGCGWGNEWIYNEIEHSIESEFIYDKDIIVVVFSYPYRYHDKNVYGPIEILEKTHEILKPYNHYFFNGFYPLLKDEDYPMDKIPANFINPTGTLSDVLKEYEQKHDVSVWEHNHRRIYTDEDNFNIGEYHPNLLGYKVISDYIYSNIVKVI